VRRRYLVEGMVQGVGFRLFTWHLASRLGVSGWVRNLPDGRVEVVSEGTPDQLALLEAELSRGPRAASVTRVGSEEIPAEAVVPAAFEIR